MPVMGMSVYEQLATKIRSLRNGRGWSQEELADRADLHQTYISHLENGKREFSVETLCKIANAFEVEASELLIGINYSKSDDGVL